MNIRVPLILRRLQADTSGNVGVIFASCMLPLIAMVGMGIDYGRALAVRTQLQAALDATALAMSFEATSVNSTALTSNARAYFAGVFTTPPGVLSPMISISYQSSGTQQIVMTGSTSVKTFFVGLPPIGKSTIDVTGTSTVAWGNLRLRVSLALDNTGSMAQSGKITALQTATKNLLAQLKAAAGHNGDVYASIIPFVEDVNIGNTNYNANWIEWTDWDAYNGSCAHGQGNNAKSCKANHGTWTHKAHNIANWNGCVTDRGMPGVSGALSAGPSANNYDTNVVSSTIANAATLFPPEPQQGSRACPLQMIGLTYDWSALNTLVNQMTPNGSTNQNIGLVWAWQSEPVPEICTGR
jgi:Flp pilus assembly protein TadG